MTGWLWRSLFLCAALALLGAAAVRKPVRTGDGLEYLYTLQAWFDHGTPDLRQGDIVMMQRLAQKSGWTLGDPYAGFHRTEGGAWLCWHFFAYPLAAVPAKHLLRLFGGDELAALQLTNAALFVLALWVALFRSAAAPPGRLALAGVSAMSPVLWYLPWTHPEVYTWAFVLMALVLSQRGRPALATLCASLGALQNPPVAALAVYTAWPAIGTRRPKTVLVCAAALALAFLPAATYQALYGVPSLIVARDAARADQISLARTASVLFDLNQGLLPHAPLALGLALAALARRRGLGLGAVLLAMVLGSETSVNWNAGAAGLMRYGVWMMPLLGALVARQLDFGHGKLALAAVAVQALLLPFGGFAEECCRQGRLASLVLRVVPQLYSPDPEIFAERQLGREGDYTADLPIPFIGAGGIVTKVLVDGDSAARLSNALDGDLGWISDQARACAGRGPTYLHPPAGALVARGLSAARADELTQLLALDVLARTPRLRVRVTNIWRGAVWTGATGDHESITLRARAGGRETRALLPVVLRAHQNVEVELDAPAAGLVELAPVLDRLGWPSHPHSI